MKSVYCAVRTGSLNKAVWRFVFKGLSYLCELFLWSQIIRKIKCTVTGGTFKNPSAKKSALNVNFKQLHTGNILRNVDFCINQPVAVSDFWPPTPTTSLERRMEKKKIFMT
jgi:hypothetical protein